MGVIKVKYNNEWVQIPTFVVNDSIDLSYYATKTDLASKQDTISDLANIRQGANLGATALQSIPDEYVTSDILDGYVTSDVLNSYVTNEYAQESLQVKLVPGANVTIVDNEDGTQTINTVASSPLLNEEYGNIVNRLLEDQPETISQEDYDKLYSFASTSENGMAHCEVLNANMGIVKILVVDGDGEINCYCHAQNTGTNSFYTAFYIISIKSDLTFTTRAYGGESISAIQDGIYLAASYVGNDDNYQHSIEFLTTGDGNKVLADNGKYVKLPSQSTFSDTSANFEPSATYTDFPYQSRIALEGVTANDFVEVVFGINEALSGNYAPVCLTENGYVTIYSKVSDTITIPTIIIHK